MMIRLFRSPQPMAMFALPGFLALLVLFASLGDSPLAAISAGWFPFSSVLNWMQSFGFLGVLFNIPLLLIQAFLVNYLVDSHRLLPKQSYLPAFVYLLVAGSFSSLLSPNPVVLANLFLLLAFHQLLRLSNASQALPPAFNFGLLIGLGSFFYPPAIVFFPLIFVSLTYFRNFQLREWLVPLIGFGLPMVYLWVAYSYFLPEFSFWNPVGMTTDALEVLLWLTPSEWGFLVVGGIAFGLSFRPFVRLIGVNKVRMRRSLELLVWTFFVTLASQWLEPGPSHQILLLIAFPLSVFFANYALQARRPWVAELVFGVWVILAIYHQATGQ